MDEDQLILEELAPEEQPNLPVDNFRPSVPAFDLQDKPKPAALPGLPGSGIGGAAAAPFSLATPTKTDAAPKRKKRWLAGRGDAKRRKLQQNNKLEAWLSDNGVWVSDKADWGQQPSGVSLAVETREVNENEISGRGLVASRNIDLYEELVRVPLKLLLTRDSAREKFGKDVIAQNMSEYSAIALQLIDERYRLGDKSFWSPYVDILPTTEEIGASFAWDQSELEMLLVGSPLLNMSMYLRQKVEGDFANLQETLFSKYPEKFPADVFTVDRYIWAYACLFSRAVRLDFPDTNDFVGLVPYVDLINHNAGSETYIKGILDGPELPFGLQEKERFIMVMSDKYYDKYEQIYLSYGPKSNLQLLMLYGFCLERNNEDYLDLVVAPLLENSPMAELKKRVLDEQQMERQVFPLYRDRFANEMMQFLRLLVVQPEDLNTDDSDESRYEAMAKLDLTQASGELSERRVLICLKGICEEAMNQYSTTIEEDEALMQDRSMFELLPKNQRNAIRVRLGEKMILRATINTVDRSISNVGRLGEVLKENAEYKANLRKTWWGRLGFEIDPAFKATNIEEFMKELDI